MLTPAKIKADLVFVASLIAVFGFNIPDSISVALVASAGLIAALLNFGDTLVKKYDPALLTGFTSELKTVESDLDKLLPAILPVLEALPGKIGQEVATAIQDIEAQKNKPGTDAPKAVK